MYQNHTLAFRHKSISEPTEFINTLNHANHKENVHESKTVQKYCTINQ